MAARKRAIVVGGGAAGMSAASQMQRAHPELEIKVYEKGPHVSYGACGMPYYIAGEIPSWEDLLVMRPEQFEARGIQVNTGHEVAAIAPAARRLEIRTPDGKVLTEHYDYLALGTGGAPAMPPFEGIGLESVFVLRSLEDGIALRTFLDRQVPKKAAIVGAGFIGLEMAEALVKRNLRVTLIGRSPGILPSFGESMAKPVVDELRARGVELMLGTQVRGLEGQAGRVRAVVTDQGRVEADFVLLAVGLRPGTGLLQGTGITLGATGAIAVSDRMKTDMPGIYAAGDCVEVPHIVSGEKVFSPLALTANRTGRVAGDNLAAEARGRVSSQRFHGTAGTLITKICGFTAARTGLDPVQAEKAGFEVAVFERQSRSRAGYYPGGSAISTRIAVDRKTRRLLGAQMIGREGVAGRIDVFAAALFRRMTVDEIYNLDLAYAPPYGPVYDPVIDICGKAGLELDR